MEPHDATENLTPAGHSPELETADADDPRPARPAGTPLDPLERLGLVFFAFTLVGLVFVVPVVWDIFRAPSRATPIYEVSAAKLYAAFEADARAAQERYGGKQVLLTGSIHGFGKEASGAPRVELEGAGPRVVRCLFGSDEPGVLAGLQRGKKVTVRGTCEGRAPSGDVVIRATTLQ